jgi:GTP-binding protein
MEISRSVALVGRPNVGKSRLFNRLAGRRISIVHDQPGVTRDLVTATLPWEHGGYLLMDTGGLGLPEKAAPAGVARATEEQVDFAIQAAALVLLVVDAREGLTPADEHIAARLRRSRKKVLLVVNKADHDQVENATLGEFYRLGLGEPAAVSAEHGRGMDGLRARVLAQLGPPPEVAAPAPAEDDLAAHRVRLALVGRPNVGKSSLANALLNSPRLIVSPTPGTTRDAVAINFDYAAANGGVWPFTLLDTAGLLRSSQIKQSVDYFSQTRTREAFSECDVAFLVLESQSGVTQQDQRLAGEVLAAGTALVIVVNKWDLARDALAREAVPGYHDERTFQRSFRDAIARELFFMPGSPILFVSAESGLAVADILRQARSTFSSLRRPLPTSRLNRALAELIEKKPPKLIQGRRFKCYYALQVARQPFVIRMFCNQEEKLDESYARYLEAGVIEAFALRGCPVRFELEGKPKRAPGDRPGRKRKAASSMLPRGLVED